MIKQLLISSFIILSHPTYAQKVIGILQGKQEIIIKSKSQGEVMEIILPDGSHVNKGDTLAIIDNEKEQIEYELARNEFITAKEDYQKSMKLKKYISKEELTKKKNLYLTKKSSLALKHFNLKTKKITTPIRGTIARRYIKVGENISSGIEAFEVVQADKLNINLDIDAKLTQNLSIGDELEFVSELRKKIHMAQIYFIGPTIDKSSGTINVKLRLDNPRLDDGTYMYKPGEMIWLNIGTE